MHLQTHHNIAWLPQPNEVHLVLTDTLPPLQLVTASMALAFKDECVLLTNLVQRGWDIPGGHIEPGEHPEETVQREVYEEAGARLGELHLFAYQHMVIRAAKPKAYRYPYPESYQVFYVSIVEALDTFASTDEARERALFAPDEANKLGWIQRHQDLYQTALALSRKLS